MAKDTTSAPKATGSASGGGAGGPSPTAAPPATTPQSSATAPCQDCPLKALKPCDVQKLIVKVTGVLEDDDGYDGQKKIETTRVRRLDAVSDVKDKAVLRLLQQYDLVADTLADPNDSRKASARPAKMDFRAYFHGRKCSPQAHALVLVEDLYDHKTTPYKQPGAEQIYIPEKTYWPNPSFVDKSADRNEAFDNLTSVFGIIKALWDQGSPREIAVDAQSCGILAPGAGGGPNKQLRALVRVFRKSKWSLGLAIPPFGSFEEKKEASVDIRREKSSSESTKVSAGGNFYQSETSSERRGEGVLGEYTYKQQRQVGGDVRAYEQSRSVENGSVSQTFSEQYSRADGRKMVNKDGTLTNTEIKERLKRASGFELVVSYNDHEVKLGEALENIKEQINRIVEVIRDIQKLFDRMPQIGWKFSFEVSVFAGKLMAEWKSKYGPGPMADGRYLPVYWDLHGRVDIELISLTLKLSFGVDLRVLKTGLVCLLEGSITLKASVGADFKIRHDKPVEKIDVEASATAKLSAVGSATVLGFTLVEAELSVDGGIELKDGELEISWSLRKFDLKGRLISKKIQLTGYLRRRLWWDKKLDPPKIILKERLLHEFT